MDLSFLATPEAWIALVSLTLLEVVLGIDNLIFISILSAKLPPEQQPRARQIGLMVALAARVVLLFSIAWVVKLEKPFWTADLFGLDLSLSGKDLVLILGGLFLLAKSTYEIHEKLEGDDGQGAARVTPTFASVILQIALLDVVFSLDSVITAVGMVKHVPIMVAAVVIAMGVMLAFVNQMSAFVDRHPTIKMLALAFLILIGTMLVAEGFHQRIPKGYIYFAMAFSIGVELLNMRMRSKAKPVQLHQTYR